MRKNFFKKILTDPNEGKTIGLSYFKERGFSIKTISDFDLGFSPNEINYFSKNALKKGYDKIYLEKTGLSIFSK